MLHFNDSCNIACSSIVRELCLLIKMLVVHLQLLWFICQSVLGQDTEPQIAPDGCVNVCVRVP